MRSLIPHLIIALSLLLTNSCTLFKKNISNPVTVAYNEEEFIATISSSALNTKYVYNASPEKIAEAFLSGFKSEGTSTRNVKLVTFSEEADFILHLKYLQLSESSRTQKINDEKSPYHGKEMLLNTVECSAVIEITDVKKSKKLLDCSNIKSRSEQVKNNRDLGDLITGTNKDRTEYRTKLLSDNVCENLAESVGRRIWVPVTRRLAKSGH